MTEFYDFKDAFDKNASVRPLETNRFFSGNNNFAMPDGTLLPTRRNQIKKLHTAYNDLLGQFLHSENEKVYKDFTQSLIEPLTRLAKTLGDESFESTLDTKTYNKDHNQVSIFKFLEAASHRHGVGILWVQNELLRERNVVFVSYYTNPEKLHKLLWIDSEDFNFNPMNKERVFSFDNRLITDQETYLAEVAKLVKHEKMLRVLDKKNQEFKEQALERATRRREKQELLRVQEQKAAERALKRLQRYIRVIGGSYDSISFSDSGTEFDVERFRLKANSFIAEEEKERNYPYEAVRSFIKYAETQGQTVYIEDLMHLFLASVVNTLNLGEKHYRTYYKNGNSQPIYRNSLTQEELANGSFDKTRMPDTTINAEVFKEWRNQLYSISIMTK